ncbi:TerC/Alx family metal homeostasis membrane protein [Sphingobacterium psychroaquaticum]|uniref:Tellurite resistance protein TerC n=1 Tax=Sphingobacterium psychroaquaticum TaxID=561061 RepID=A0A1X7J5F3_9SPHI|nr:TerC/Alx family metal homeostasis membrane protein [Sphingobacterium psychroaquaticum]QBQ40042.1 TerC/Alx family metal homeostasis membrane protein [Sphingobacterium psychroaquaticum]SMG22963.1 tellurite resistance protein TerC [Sphingobacterium psychroaquaticum]
MSHELLFFGGFIIFIVLMLAIDLGLFSKSDKPVSLKAAAIMSAIWVLFALAFGLVLYFWGNELHNVHDFETLKQVVAKHLHNIKINENDLAASIQTYNANLTIEYLTGYVVEYALSVDNIFVMVLLFSSFGIPEKYYHKVLVWGIIGAILLRCIFIFVGAALIAKFGWILYVFGAFLVYTGINMYITRNKEEEVDPQNHPVVKFASKYFKVTPRLDQGKFFHVENGVKYMTPLFLVLLVIEFTDLIFAVDSIPAIFSVTKDPYIVFFSNIFAVLGLRSMFFLLVNIIHKFHYLKVGLAFLLIFIGAKMLLHGQLEAIGFKTIHSLIIIISILVISVIASLMFPKKEDLTQ